MTGAACCALRVGMCLRHGAARSSMPVFRSGRASYGTKHTMAWAIQKLPSRPGMSCCCSRTRTALHFRAIVPWTCCRCGRYREHIYAIVITREPYDIAMRAQYGGIGFAYGYYTDRSSNYGGWKSYANNIPQSSLYKASYSNGILTIAKGASWNEYLWVGFDYKYIILG